MAKRSRSADEIIRNLRDSPKAYRDAARKEGSVWGPDVLGPGDSSAVREDEQGG